MSKFNNLIFLKDRIFDETEIVEVYRNLHGNKEEIYSIRQNNLVIAHCNDICLKNCSCIVHPKGRKRVQLEQRKNVHAYIRGYITEEILYGNIESITYNPYKYSTFVYKSDEKPIHHSDIICLTKDGVFVPMR